MYEPSRYPIYIPPPPPDKKSLTQDLTWAVKHRDSAAARSAFDRAFWAKIDLLPDWHHLLCAVAQNDTTMVRLLVAHGARWTVDEARGLKEIFPQEWPAFVETLRRSGGDTDFGQNLPPADIRTRLLLVHRITAEDGDIFSVGPLRAQMDGVLSETIVRHLIAGDAGSAAELLRLRQPKGAVNIDAEFSRLLELSKDNLRYEIETLARIQYAGVSIAPLRAEAALVRVYPEVIPMLDRHSLLDGRQPERMDLIRAWSQAPAEDQERYRLAAAALFKPRHPLEEGEVREFISLYRQTPEARGEIMERLCDDLMSAGFFGGPAWTADNIRALSERVTEGSALKQAFNRKIASDRFSRMEAKVLARPENLFDFAAAHRNGSYRSGNRQVCDLLDQLQKKYADGRIPQEIREALQEMGHAGADFSLLWWRHAYLGGKEPGLMKILLDMGALEPRDVDLDDVHEKAKLPRGAVTVDPRRHSGPYVEFFCQVYLEQNFPQEFIPLRGKVASYSVRLAEKNPPPPRPRRSWPFWGR